MRQQSRKICFFFLTLVKVNVKGIKIAQFWKMKIFSYGLDNYLSKNVCLYVFVTVSLLGAFL